MTRREYQWREVNGDRLQSELIAAGLPPAVDMHRRGDYLVALWREDLSLEQIALADSTVAAHDWTEAKERAERRRIVREQAVNLAGSLDDAMAVIARNGNRVTYQAVTALWQTTRALIAWANAQGANLQQLPPPRTWKQVLDAGRNLAASETDPEN